MHSFFFRLPLHSQFISMWVIVYCLFLQSLAVCLPTGCAGKSVWVPIWQMIPGKCGRAKHFWGTKAEFIRSIPFHLLQQHRDLCHVKMMAVRALHLHRQLKHPLDLQVCDTPYHGKHSSITPPQGKCQTAYLGLREKKAFTLFTPMGTSEESPTCINWVRHLGDNKNIQK